MNIVEKILRQHELSIFNPEQMAIFDLPDEDFVTWKEAAHEIERLREELIKIAVSNCQVHADSTAAWAYCMAVAQLALKDNK